MSAALNVLVVDDEPKVCQLLEQILRSRGCAVRIAHNGFEALKQFKRQAAEVVITDLKMPQLDGFELLRELKRQDPYLSVIVITAYPSIEGAVEAMRYGACDFITKPFDITQVHAILYRCQQRLTLNRQLHHATEGTVKLEELNRRLSELNDLKSQFLAGISRGVNTPLCLMSESIYLLSEGSLGPLSSDQEKAVDALISAYERLYRLLQQLVDLMQGSELELRRGLVNVQDLVRQAVGTVMPRASARSMTIACQLPEEPIPMDIDWVRCVEALGYLLDNAIKFNRDRGRIDVEVVPSEAQIEVRIRDTGIGIPPEECEKVLQPFYRAGPPSEGTAEGPDVGLTLAKRYVELHGGSLQLSSKVGKGTTVVVALPRPQTAVHLPQAARSTG